MPQNVTIGSARIMSCAAIIEVASACVTATQLSCIAPPDMIPMMEHQNVFPAVINNNVPNVLTTSVILLIISISPLELWDGSIKLTYLSIIVKSRKNRSFRIL